VIGTLGVAAVFGKGSSKAKTTVTYQNVALTPEGKAAAEAAKAEMANASKTEAMEQLKSLTELRDMGAISADEYEKKRAQVSTKAPCQLWQRHKGGQHDPDDEERIHPGHGEAALSLPRARPDT
jgi:hypothetical protein